MEAYRDLIDSGALYQAMLSSEKDYLTTRVSFKLNLRGPSLNVQTACSSSGVAIHLASQSLLSGDCDMALAGGGRIRVPLRAGYHYVEGGIPSPDGYCRAFDQEAQGCVFGSGMALVVLRRLRDAIRDGDHIHAILRGTAINNDGSAKVGFTAPSIHGQAAVIAEALAVADVHPNDISFVEAHGTGTTLGDPIEVAALTRAFQGRDPSVSPIRIGSVKTNIGHLDAGAAVAGLIKTVLALEHKQIPPSLHFGSPNPEIDFAHSPVRVITKLNEWKVEAGPRRAGISAFGLGGTNFHGVLEETPDLLLSGPSRPWHLFLLSAKTREALEEATKEMARHLRCHPEINLADAAHTLQVGRSRFSERRALVIRTHAQILDRLENPKAPEVITHTCRDTNRPVVFMFPGQGAQYAGMGGGLYESENVFREVIDRCAFLLKPHLGFDITDLLFPDQEGKDLADEQLKRTAITQPALFSVEYALATLWKSWGVDPNAMIGHSIGEYVAACLSGVFSLENALELVCARGRLMETMPEGSMLAVHMPEAQLGSFLGDDLSLAVVNAVNSCVVSGPKASVEELEGVLSKNEISFRRLRTSHAFHSAMMEPILEPFREEVRAADPQPPSLPFVSNVSGTWISEAEATDPDYWARQLRHTVRFSDGMRTLFKDPGFVFLEVGPGRTLATLARQHPEKGPHRAIVQSLPHPKDLLSDQALILSALGRLWMAGAEIDWPGFHEGESRRRVPLPTYPFERTRHWLKTSVSPAPGPSELPGPRPHALLPDTEEEVGYRPETAPVPSAALNRQGRLVNDLQRLFAELTGMEDAEIDADTAFLELGFESLTLTQACATLRRRFSIKVTLGQLMEECQTVRALAEHLDATLPVTQAPEPLVTEDIDFPGTQGWVTDPRSEDPNAGREAPLTDGQQEIWLAAQMGDDGSCAFNLSNTVRIKGPLNLDALREAIQGLVDRHEALRGTVDPDGFVLRIAPSLQVEPLMVDLSSLDMRAQEARLRELGRGDVETPFGLESGPLIRPTLIRLDSEDHLLFLTVHHIVADGWSCGVLTRELGELYDASLSTTTPKLPAAAQFGEYAKWFEQARVGPEADQAEEYWLSIFGDSIPVMELPTDHARPKLRTYNAAREGIRLEQGLAEGLKRVAASYGSTLFTLTLTVFEVLLHRLTGQRDLVIGVSAAGQANLGAQNLVGHCVNFLPLRLNLQEDSSFDAHLRAVRKKVSDGFRHQSCSYGSLLQKLKIPRDPDRIPLVSVVHNLGAVRPGLGFDGLDVELGSNPRSYENFEIFSNVVETHDTIEIQWTYNTDLFNAETIRRWLHHYETLLETFFADPTADVAEAPLLSVGERRQILREWNDTAIEYERNTGIHEWIEAQADRTPEAIALVAGDSFLTYGELDRRANQLARHLGRLGVGPGGLVGLSVERSAEMVVALLGVLKAGAAYLPLDPEYPGERLQFMLEDAQASVLLTESRSLDDLPTHQTPVCMDTDWPSIGRESQERPGKRGCGEDLAYVIYTSGSTGRPKGVQVPHRAVVNFLLSMAKVPGLSADDVLVAVTTMSFDISVLELLLPLVVGARVVVAEREEATDGRALLELLKNSRATVMQATPATWRMLLEAGWGGGDGFKVLVGGEALAQDLALDLVKRSGSVWNMYGPTETTVWSTCWQVARPEEAILIGRPIGNTQVYILDRNREPVPVGVTGELYIGGEGVTKGYLNRPELTVERFVQDPFVPEDLSFLYRTGDLARYRPDGQIVCLGREDNQVKVRGFRIELDEVETLLLEHGAVMRTAVVVREDREGDQRLVAYFVSESHEETTPTELRRHLRRRLPEYMIPQLYVELDTFPLTPNGKIDRRSLPSPMGPNQVARESIQPPKTRTEKTVAGIWQELLGLAAIERHDNFFDLGGHSLLSLRALTRIEAQTGARLPARLMVLENLEQIAAELDRRMG